MMNTEYTPAPSEHVDELFQRLVPHIELDASILSRLIQALNDGHSYIYVNEAEQAQLEQAYPIVGIAQPAPLVLQGKRLFIGRYWHIESQLATHIHRLAAAPCAMPSPQLIQCLNQWFLNSGSEDQQAAAALTLLKKFILINGGPGTGKTTTVAKLLALLCLDCTDTLPRIALAAPTGKAAARMSEALNRAVSEIPDLPPHIAQHLSSLNGQTIHRLLNLMPPKMQSHFGPNHPLPLDIVLLDEASMLDSYLLLQTLMALPTGCRVILLGDENQLPSVGVGATVAALRQSEALSPQTHEQLMQILPREHYSTLSEHLAMLTISHRFSKNSAIGNLARAVSAGQAQEAWQQFQHFPEHLHHQTGKATSQAKALYQAQQDYWQAVAEQNIAAAFAQHQKLMVLAAHHSEAEQLNQAYIQLLQTMGHRSEQTWFAGQIIMITRNDFNQKLFNGDIGIILPNQDKLFAWFDNGKQQFRSVHVSRLPEHETAFAITVHKSQGSEYDNIWFLAPDSPQGLNRALLYTAITRAKSNFYYWGESATFQAACLQEEIRRSALSDFLRSYKKTKN